MLLNVDKRMGKEKKKEEAGSISCKEDNEECDESVGIARGGRGRRYKTETGRKMKK